MPQNAPFQPVDDAARALARQLLRQAGFAALGAVRPETGTPTVTRIALATGPDGLPLSLVSTLATHTRALQENPACALLVGEPTDRGDPLTHSRMTLHATAEFVSRDSPNHDAIRAHYLAQKPKAKLYIDFADFRLLRFHVRDAALNAGFGKAFLLSPRDLGLED